MDLLRLKRVLGRSGGRIALAVEAGQVACPGHGLIDIETCFACRGYWGLSGRHSQELLCRDRDTATPPMSAYSVLAHQEV
jgi:hypothetical protein